MGMGPIENREILPFASQATALLLNDFSQVEAFAFLRRKDDGFDRISLQRLSLLGRIFIALRNQRNAPVREGEVILFLDSWVLRNDRKRRSRVRSGGST